MNNPVQKKYAVVQWLNGEVRKFLKKFTADSIATDLAVTGLVYKAIAEIE